MAFVSNQSPTDDNQSSGTDLSIINTEDEIHIDTANWTTAKWKKLQYMTKFHKEYQWVFGEKASIHTLMKRRISHMNPAMPDSVRKEEMQSAMIDNSDIVIEYITDGQGNKIKKLKPLLIKTEPDREYVQHIHSDDNLPNIPEYNFTQKRDVTIDSYSETISSNPSSNDSTITADNDDESTSSMEDKPCVWETNVTEVEASLQQIASGLQNAAEGYLTLASHISKLAPYELPQIVAEIPPPPMDVPMPIRKALSADGESKVVNYLLCGEYEMTNTSWSKLQINNLSKNKIYSALKGKRRPRGSQYWQKKKLSAELKSSTSHTNSGTD